MRSGGSRWVIGFLAVLALGASAACASAPALAAKAAKTGSTAVAGTVPRRAGGAVAAAASVVAPAGEQLMVGQMTVPAGHVYVGNVDLVAGSLVVDGTLRGGVTMTAGRVAVGGAGRITGSVQLGTGLIQVAPGGRIEGAVQVGDHSQANLLCPAGGSSGCTVSGGAGGSLAPTFSIPGLPGCLGGCTSSVRVVRVLRNGILGRVLGLGPWVGALAVGLRLLTWLGLLALALPVAAIWPEAVDGVRRQIEREPGRSALVGLLALVLALPVLLAISITIVGIPVAFAAALGLVAALFFGFVALVGLVGARTGALARGGLAPGPLWAIVLGSAILAAVGWVPLLGGLVSFAVACVGIGAVLLSRFGTNRPWLPPRRGPDPAPAQVPPAGPTDEG